MEITRIVITGGPCAGKTTAMSWIQNAFTQMGYTVLFEPETATELISGGVAPWTCGTNLEYQKCQMRLQLVKDQLFLQAARTMKAEKLLIVCDRGAMDNKAYMSEEEFAQVLADNYTNEVELRDSYDAVFHLVTAAKGAAEFYSNANNAARYEDVDGAVALDDRLIACWTGHPHLYIIDNSREFDKKMNHLISEIAAFLGAPDVKEKERKFLIARPDPAWLESIPGCKRIEMKETWLRGFSGGESRIRQRGIGSNLLFFETKTRSTANGGTIETEKRLTRDRYLEMMERADPDRKPISKTRYFFTYKAQYIKIDLYPEWPDKAVAEIEVNADSNYVMFPEELQVISETDSHELLRMLTE